MNYKVRAALPKDIINDLGDFGDIRGELFVEQLLSANGLVRGSVYRYVSYLKTIIDLAYSIAEVYDLRSPKGSYGKKDHLRHVGPLEMIYIANYLYILDSYGVSGSVLECGTSHGYSTCVLSHACHLLGRKIYAADSFSGLPSVREDEPFFREGDYAASIANVKRNISYLGETSAVSYIQGFYCDSLPKFCEEICLLWLDVDLFDSAADVMRNIVGQFNRSGVIFCHEFTDYDNKVEPRTAKRPPNAVYDVLDQAQITYKKQHLLKYFGAIGFSESIQWDCLSLLPLLHQHLYRMDSRWRYYEELSQSNTVKMAFTLKKCLSGWRKKQDD